MTIEGFDFDKVEVFEFLDALRESGVTNMFGATPYIQKEYGLEESQSSELLFEWMDTFSERHSRTES